MKNKAHRHLGIPLGGVLLLLLALSAGCATAPTKPASSSIAATPVQTGDLKNQEELRQLDAFLDRNLNAALETELRQDVTRANDATFLERYPEWKQFTLDRPAVTAALTSENQFLLHRALARMTGHLPLEARHLAWLDNFLGGHPAIQDALETDPALLTNLDFLLKYPALAEFFDQHPDLYSVFFEHAGQKVALQTRPAD